MRVAAWCAIAGVLWVGAFHTMYAEEEAASSDHAQGLFLLDTAYPQERGSLQLTLSGAHLHFDDGHESEVALQLEYGITDRVQVEAVFPVRWFKEGDESDKGLGDIELGLLGAITPVDSPLTVSFSLDFRLPTGNEDKGLGDGSALDPKILMAWELHGVIVHANLGAEITPDEQAVNYGVAVERDIESLSLIVEFSGETNSDTSTCYITPGVAWRPTSWSEIALGTPFGLTDAAADWGVVALFTIEF